MLSRILILFLITSCSLFKGSEKIGTSETEKVLASVRVTGEGKGRLHIRERQYLFGIESALREDASWIMGVSIPLHGEEALIFSDLKEKKTDSQMESFAQRIDAGIRENFKELTGRDFLLALRKNVRFLLAHKLGLEVKCTESACIFDGDEFFIERQEKALRIISGFSGHQLVTTASNLTGPFFLRTQFRVISPAKKQELLTLELFWQE